MLSDLTSIKGIGEKRAAQLMRLGVRTPEALIEYLPRDYLDYSHVTAVSDVRDGGLYALHVEILTDAKLFAFRGITMVSARARDESGEIKLTWFNQPYRRMQVKAGKTLYACGRVSLKKGAALLNPTLADELPGILPVYPSVKGVSQRVIREAVFAAIKACWDKLPETLPLPLLADHALCSRKLALRHAHFPANLEILGVARRRLEFERALLYQLAVTEQIRHRQRSDGVSFDTAGVRERFLKKIPFQLTGAQSRVLDELDADMRSRVPMNRLLQGDVGSGKTVVALYALCVAAANGWQGALLAPTEIVAQQHYKLVQAIFGEAAVLLTGSMKGESRARALSRIEDGTALCVVGTHAILQSGVRFYRLGLVITDEQHRFGVRQRAAIEEKGVRPDVLVMSATPIPRTLALLLFGDLELSILDELPPGRKPVITRLIPESKREDLYMYLAKCAAEGVQSFVVCPFIEEPETMDGKSVEAHGRELKRRLPDTRVATLHGRMREEKKREVVEAFLGAESDILVCTTLVEVGVHVPGAGVMVIENAERFGLAQLHQLRGRVGRSERQAYCFLLSGVDAETANERLRVMTETNDGFLIAEKDRLLRGSGDFLGTRQHGESAISFDMSILTEAKKAAKAVEDAPSAENNALIERALALYGPEVNHITMN